MNFNWEHYLIVAEKLIEEETNEAVYRIAISRAYYAAFCLGRNYIRDHLKHEIILSNDAQDHGQVIDFFKSSSHSQRRQVGSRLRRLRDFRNSADYDDDLISQPRATAQSSVIEARFIVDTIKNWRASPHEDE